MHEATLAVSLMDLIADAVRREGCSRAISATIEVGALSAVEPEALVQAIEVASMGGAHQGLRLVIERPMGAAHCMACGSAAVLASRAEPCPACGSHKLLVTGGEGLRLKDLEVV
jgi:hydrogenase nickel incorporation protein HypA/HybF